MYYLLTNGLARTLYLFVQDYSNQFSWEMWKLVVWAFRAISDALKYCEG